MRPEIAQDLVVPERGFLFDTGLNIAQIIENNFIINNFIDSKKKQTYQIVEGSSEIQTGFDQFGTFDTACSYWD